MRWFTVCRQRVDAVKARTKGLPAPRVFMPIWYDPITTIGKNAFITEIIDAAGGRSVTDDLPDGVAADQHGGRAGACARCTAAGSRRQDDAKGTWRIVRAGAAWRRSRRIAPITSTSGSISQAQLRSMHWRTSQNNFILELNRSACNHPLTARCREARCKSATTP